jgi:hypothetical protein
VVCAPLLGITAAIIVPVSLLAYENIRALFRHFTWGLIISPSFYCFAATTISSITVPISLLKGMPKIFAEAEGKRLVAVVTGVALILLWSAVFQILIWGSYPLGYDKLGNEHLRLIPFIPWPTESLLHWLLG